MNGTSSRGIPLVLAGLSIISTVAGWSIPIVITLGVVGKIPWWWTPVAVLLSGPVVWLAIASLIMLAVIVPVGYASRALGFDKKPERGGEVGS